MQRGPSPGPRTRPIARAGGQVAATVGTGAPMGGARTHLREGGHRDGVPKRRGRERGQAAYKVEKRSVRKDNYPTRHLFL